MRQELIEKAVDLFSSHDQQGLPELGAKMTEQERRYAIGVIEDKRDDALSVLMGWDEGAVRKAMYRSRRIRKV